MQNYLTYAEYDIIDMKGKRRFSFSFELSRLAQTDSCTRIVCVLAVSSFLLTTIATFSDYWLYEVAVWSVPAPMVLGNGAQTKNSTDELKRQLRSNSGLWRICCSDDPCMGKCRTLDGVKSLFENAGSQTNFIGILRNSNAFPILSMILAFVGGIVFFGGIFLTKPRASTPLASGILFVLSGLMSVLGLIIYISNNDKLSITADLPAYGWSFYFAGVSFLFSEIVGVTIVQSTLKDSSQEDDADDAELDDTEMKGCDQSPSLPHATRHVPCTALRHDNNSFRRLQSISNDLISPLCEDDEDIQAMASQMLRPCLRSDPLLPRGLDDRTQESNLTHPSFYPVRRARGLDRIEELAISGEDGRVASSNSSGTTNSTRQTVTADVEPNNFKFAENFDNIPSNAVYFKDPETFPRRLRHPLQHSDPIGLSMSDSGDGPMFSMSKHYSLEKTRVRLGNFHQSSDETDNFSPRVNSVESIPPPMEFMTMPTSMPLPHANTLPSVMSFSHGNRPTPPPCGMSMSISHDNRLPHGRSLSLPHHSNTPPLGNAISFPHCNTLPHEMPIARGNTLPPGMGMSLRDEQQSMAGLDYVLPYQNVRMLHPESMAMSARARRKLKMPVVQKMKTFEKPKKCEQITSFSSKTLPLLPSNEGSECAMSNGDSGSVSRTPHSLSVPFDAASTDSQTKGSVHSSQGPSAVSTRISPLLGQDEKERVFGRTSFGRGDPDVRRVGSYCDTTQRNGGVKTLSQIRRETLERQDSLEMQLHRLQTLDGPDSASAWQSCYTLPLAASSQDHHTSYCSVPNGGIPFDAEDLMMPNHSTVNRKGICRSFSTNALCMRERKAKLPRTRSFMNIARRLVNSKGLATDGMGNKIKAFFASKSKRKSSSECGTPTNPYADNSEPMMGATAV